MAAACPANEFLVAQLLELQRAEPSDKKKALFTTAVASIRKFPLPIVSKADALDLMGVGRFIGGTIGAILDKSSGAPKVKKKPNAPFSFSQSRATDDKASADSAEQVGFSLSQPSPTKRTAVEQIELPILSKEESMVLSVLYKRGQEGMSRMNLFTQVQEHGCAASSARDWPELMALIAKVSYQQTSSLFTAILGSSHSISSNQ